MSSLPFWGYGLILVGSLFLSLVLTPVAIGVAVRFGVLDHPGPAKAHVKAVPYLGGTAIVVSFAGVVLVAALLRPPPSGLPQLAGLPRARSVPCACRAGRRRQGWFEPMAAAGSRGGGRCSGLGDGLQPPTLPGCPEHWTQWSPSCGSPG